MVFVLRLDKAAVAAFRRRTKPASAAGSKLLLLKWAMEGTRSFAAVILRQLIVARSLNACSLDFSAG